jgi:hypothetical protein
MMLAATDHADQLWNIHPSLDSKEQLQETKLPYLVTCGTSSSATSIDLNLWNNLEALKPFSTARNLWNNLETHVYSQQLMGKPSNSRLQPGTYGTTLKPMSIARNQ